MAKRNKQTGTPNSKSIGASGKKWAKSLNPWGKPTPKRSVPSGGVGSTTKKKPRMDPQLLGMKYPPNDPLLWPVEIDKVNHTQAPPTSGINAAVIAKNNAAVENAYTRAKYQ
jgi:hypothetical protein